MSTTTASKTISVLREVFARYVLPQQLVSDNDSQSVANYEAILKAGLSQGIPVEQTLMKFLLHYRITPHAVTGASPSSLFLGRNIRTRLDLLHPDIESRIL